MRRQCLAHLAHTLSARACLARPWGTCMQTVLEVSMSVTFPNESPEYRSARRKLLQREVSLRREMEGVAAQVRALPPGGAVSEDYEFDHIGADGASAKVRLSELFRPGTDALIVYHYMFPRHRND